MPHSEHASRNAEDTFLGVEFNVFGPKAFECNVELVYQITDLLGFDNDIVDVSLDGWSNVYPKIVLHASLVRSPCVLETEGHCNVEIHAK
jgi:hypothetical protein